RWGQPIWRLSFGCSFFVFIQKIRVGWEEIALSFRPGTVQCSSISFSIFSCTTSLSPSFRPFDNGAVKPRGTPSMGSPLVLRLPRVRSDRGLGTGLDLLSPQSFLRNGTVPFLVTECSALSATVISWRESHRKRLRSR